MKLINAELVLTMLKAFKDEKYGNPHFMNGIATVMELIEDMPEAVVRCKDCINNILGENYNPLARHKRDCIFKPDNWFCADGERRSEDD